MPLRQDAGVIGLVGLAHLISHFSQLLLAPLFPWLKDAFSVSYTQLGFLMTLFFLVSCAVQTLSGFLVDRYGPRPILFAGLGLLGVAAFGFALSPSYWVLALFSLLAGLGNGVFHPVNYTLLNRKVSARRLGHGGGGRHPPVDGLGRRCGAVRAAAGDPGAAADRHAHRHRRCRCRRARAPSCR